MRTNRNIKHFKQITRMETKKPTKKAKTAKEEEQKPQEEPRLAIHGFFICPKINGKYRIALQNQLCSELEFNTLKEATDYIDSKPWELIYALICICLTIQKTTNKQ